MPKSPAEPRTLAFDIGGTGLKASVLDASGALLHEPVRVSTPYPCSPSKMISELVGLVAMLPQEVGNFDRISAGFPGVVRDGLIRTAPHFVTAHGPGSKVVAELVREWDRFPLAEALSRELGRPSRVANDADMQGSAVVKGVGLEMVITLGTGLGSALFQHGVLAAHLELAHHPFRKGETYNEQVGEAARERIGNKAWNARVAKAVAQLNALVVYDHLFIGGGNSRHVRVDLGPQVTLVDNSAGLAGGVHLWTR
ncbi:MAG: ROK family protein [Mycobacteriales bacterium]